MFVGQRDAGEGMPQVAVHVGKDGLAVRLAAVLDQFADIGQQCARYQRVVVNLHPLAVGLHQHLLHGDAQAAPRAHVLDEGDVHVLGQEREGNLCQRLDCPAAESHPLIPHRQRLGPQLGVADVVELGDQFLQFAHLFSSSSDNDFLIAHLHPIAGADARDVHLVHHRNIGDDGAHGHDGVGLGVDDGGRSQAIACQPVECVGANGAALARRKDEHSSGHTFAFERVAWLNDHARIRVHAAQEADGVGGDEGFACGVAGFDYAGRTRIKKMHSLPFHQNPSSCYDPWLILKDENVEQAFQPALADRNVCPTSYFRGSPPRAGVEPDSVRQAQNNGAQNVPHATGSRHRATVHSEKCRRARCRRDDSTSHSSTSHPGPQRVRCFLGPVADDAERHVGIHGSREDDVVGDGQ